MMPPRAFLIAVLALLSLPPLAAQGRRVVDIVKVGDPASEREHDFAGEGVAPGAIDGRTYRQVRGWLSYSMTVYEDSEVTIACTFRGSDTQRIAFDLLVEGRKIQTPTVVPQSSAPGSVELRIPFDLTRGLTNVRVMLRGVEGSTPRLLELRTVQEHLERPWDQAPRPTGPAFW